MNIFSRGRGRPRQHRQKNDKGTSELQQKRRNILEKGLAQDAALAESLLGILYAYQWIPRPLYEAGCFFGEIGYLYKPCLGAAFRSRVHDLALPSRNRLQNQEGFLSDYEEQKRTKAWREAVQTLYQAGSLSYKIVLKVVFYDYDLYTGALPHFYVHEINALRKGLEYLDLYFRGGLKGKKDKLYDPVLTPQQPTKPPQLLKACLPLFLL